MKPRHRAIGQRLRWLEEVDLLEVAAEVGTPVYVYSATAITRAYRAWRRAFEEIGFAGERHLACFAVKANGVLALLHHLAGLGSGFDIVSGGELHRVLAAGARPDRIVFSGPAKDAESLQAAVAAGARLINVETAEEAHELARLAAERRIVQRIGLRLNPDLDPRTHPAIATGPASTKFGLAAAEIESLLEERSLWEWLQVDAVAVHIGSQITDLDPLRSAAVAARSLADRLRGADHPVEWVDLGGGLGIAYEDGERVPSPRQLAASLRDVLEGWQGGLLTEPGRVIVGPAGVLLTRVLSVRSRQPRDLVVCDAGMNALLRPALYGARHRIRRVDPAAEDGGTGRYDVVGPLCETGDHLARDVDLGGVASGDLLAVRDTGAYGHVMASEYNAHPRPAQVWVSGAAWAVIGERASYEQLTAGERLAPWQVGSPVTSTPARS